MELTAFSFPSGHTEGVRPNHTAPIKPISLSAKVYRMLWGNAITCRVTHTHTHTKTAEASGMSLSGWRCFFHSCSRRYAALSSSPRATLAPFCITNERWKHFFTLSCGAFDSLWQAVHIFVASFFSVCSPFLILFLFLLAFFCLLVPHPGLQRLQVCYTVQLLSADVALPGPAWRPAAILCVLPNCQSIELCVWVCAVFCDAVRSFWEA